MNISNTWDKIKEILSKSKYDIVIAGGKKSSGLNECEQLGIPEDSVLASVITNCNGICVDNWIRILGQGSEKQNGILYYNTVTSDECLDGLLIVAHDAVGGIYAINSSRFEKEQGLIWYFAPDYLEWESLGMKYGDFIAWAAQGNIAKFYEAMRWKDWSSDCKNLEFDTAYLIYPFLWAKECDINTADKKMVVFEELMNLNFDYSRKLQ